jgi:hypothetical protein
MLPFCQRCTGFYVGAILALLLVVVFRPGPTTRVLWAHGILLLLMIPFGYHLLPQNGTIRMLTGQLFAVGLVYYFCLLPLPSRQNRPPQENRFPLAYALGVLVSLVMLQLLVHLGGRFVSCALAWLGFAGLIALAALAGVNLILAPWTLWRGIRLRRVSPLT